MAAGGITINAIVYPYYPLNSELLKRVFLRSFFGLFVTEKDDLNGSIIIHLLVYLIRHILPFKN
jgi:hypothetical protein